MSLNAAAGLQGMLKEGHTHLEGVEGVIVRNIEASNELSRILRSSLGPHGRNKLVVNHLEKITVTSDCAAIVRELEIEHPAAKMLQLAAQTQDEECGDGTNLAVSFAGELLTQSTELLRSGLHPSEIVTGFRRAGDKLTLELLPSLVIRNVPNTDMDKNSLMDAIMPVLAAKQYGSQQILAPLVAEACLAVMSNTDFEDTADTMSSSYKIVNPESVRVVKILGGHVAQSHVIYGYVAQRGLETTFTTHLTGVKVTVFGCGIEASSTEAKATVLMKNAEDLMGYNKSEEKKMEELIKAIADTGTNLVVSGGTVSEMAMHFLERYRIACLKIGSKWELRRFCSAVQATALVRLGPATPDEMGSCDEVTVQEVGGKFITVFSQSPEGGCRNGCRLSTIVLRASTSNVLADLERAVEDGVHAARMLCKDGRLVAGAGATELELAYRIRTFADSCPGLDQYAIRAFAKALEFVPKTLAENAGHDSAEILARLNAAHAHGHKLAGVDIEGGIDGVTGNMSGIDLETKVLDLLSTKLNAFRLAIDAALTVLKVDQIIMSKPAGAKLKK